MALFTVSELNEQIAAWKAALLALSTSQSYTVMGRTVTRSNRAEIWAQLKALERERDTVLGRTGPHVAVGRVRR